MIRKKQYTYVFRCNYGVIDFVIPQQSIEETLEFYDMVEQKDGLAQYRYTKDMLKKHGEIRYFGWFWNKKRLVNTFLNNYLEFIANLSKIVHKPYVSKYEGININKGPKRPPNPGSNMLVMSEKTGIPVDEIMDRLSLEEWGIYQDAIIHSNLELDKKTRSINDQAYENSKSGMTRQQKKDAMKRFKEAYKKGKKKTLYVGKLQHGNQGGSDS